MHYSENMGLVPLSREQRLNTLYNALFSAGLISMTFVEFKGTNIHRFFSESTLPLLEQVQEEQLKAIASLFTFWQERNLAIRGGFGASNEGWVNNFAGLCTGLNIVDTTRAAAEGSELSSIITVPGEVALYFDELKLDDEESQQAVHEAFKQSVWPGMITPPISEKDQEITIDFTSTGAKTYRYFNLKKDDYTTIDCEIRVTYKANSVQYEHDLLKNAFRQQFEAFNSIGKNFYPQAFLNTTEFPNLATVIVAVKKSGDPGHSIRMLPCGFGEKFQLGIVTVGDSE
jgi:hypothetical protein